MIAMAIASKVNVIPSTQYRICSAVSKTNQLASACYSHSCHLLCRAHTQGFVRIIRFRFLGSTQAVNGFLCIGQLAKAGKKMAVELVSGRLSIFGHKRSRLDKTQCLKGREDVPSPLLPICRLTRDLV